MGGGSDKLVMLDVRPGAKTYGKVIARVSVGESDIYSPGYLHPLGLRNDMQTVLLESAQPRVHPKAVCADGRREVPQHRNAHAYAA